MNGPEASALAPPGYCASSWWPGGALKILWGSSMVAHNFDVSPDECPRCQERSRNHKPATVPGIIDPDRLAAILALPSARGRGNTGRHLRPFAIAVDVV